MNKPPFKWQELHLSDLHTPGAEHNAQHVVGIQ